LSKSCGATALLRFRVAALVSGTRRVVYAIRNPQDQQRKLEQRSYNQNAHGERHDSNDQVDQPFRGRVLITEHDVSHDRDSTEDDGEYIQQLYKTAKERMIESEIKESRKEILFFGHAASWAHKSMVIAGVIQLVKLFCAGSQVNCTSRTITLAHVLSGKPENFRPMVASLSA